MDLDDAAKLIAARQGVLFVYTSTPSGVGMLLWMLGDAPAVQVTIGPLVQVLTTRRLRSATCWPGGGRPASPTTSLPAAGTAPTVFPFEPLTEPREGNEMDGAIERLLTGRPEIPTVDAIAGVPQLRDRLNELRGRRDRVSREIAAITTRPAQAAPTADAARLLLDGDGEQGEAGPTLDTRLAELRRSRRILDDAVSLGEAELKRLIRTAAPALLEPMREWHKQVVTEAARRLVEAQVLAGCEAAMLREVEAAGLPAGGIAELGQVPDVQWFISRLIADGVLTGSENWLPDEHKPTPAPAPSLVAGAINAVRRVVGGKPAKQPKQDDAGGFELWQ